MPGPRLRVVSLVASNTEIVSALGRADWLVGIDDNSDWPPEVQALPRVGPDLNVDLDRVAMLQPDLVLASLSVPGMERNVERLRTRGIPHVVIPCGGLSGVYAGIRRVGALLNAEAQAEELVATMQARMRAVQEQVSGRSVRRTYWEWWPRPPITAGGPSWMTEVLRLAGADNVFADVERESQAVTLAEVERRQPDSIVLCWCGARKLPDPRLVARRPGWAALPAVRQGRVYAVLEPEFGRPGPRLADGVEMLARLLHPRSGE